MACSAQQATSADDTPAAALAGLTRECFVLLAQQLSSALLCRFAACEDYFAAEDCSNIVSSGMCNGWILNCHLSVLDLKSFGSVVCRKSCGTCGSTPNRKWHRPLLPVLRLNPAVI